MSRSLNLSASDLDALARIVDAEAGNQSPQGKIAVMFTVLNRAASGSFADSVKGVIEQRNQFEPMIGKRSWQELPQASPATTSLISQAVAGVTAGQLADPTNGATFFQNVAITNQRGTNFASAEPTAQIGDHSFYNRYKLNPVIKVDAYGVTVNGEGGGDSAPAATDAARRDGSRVAGDAQASAGASNSFGSAIQNLTFQPHAGNALFAAAAALQGQDFAPLAIANANGKTVIAPETEVEALSRRLNINAGANSNESPTYANPSNQISSTGTTTNYAQPQTQGAYNLVPANKGVDLADVNPSILAAAQQAASLFGSNLTINSGFRSQTKQDAIRAQGDPNRPSVAKHSNHTEGTGLDISTRDMTVSDKARLVDALVASGFTGIGDYSGHIHADFRGAVPSTFGQRSNWGGWTNLPPEIMAVLQARGFAPGASSSDIRRG